MAQSIQEHYDTYVNGEWRPGVDDFTVSDPASNRPLATVAESGPDRVTEAVRAASDALEVWSGFDPSERGDILREVANALSDNADHLARVESREEGRPLRESKGLLTDAVSHYEYYAGLTDKIEGETIPVPGDRLNYTTREPLGVTAHIVPWNAATILASRSIAPALACGNTVVVHPSSSAPLSTMEVASVLEDTPLPDGVFNVVPGSGSQTGAALTEHDLVDSITFTGSANTGKTVMRAAADNLVPVSLELGGNNPSIVFPDADIDRVIEDTLKAFYNTGQVCFSTARLFVHEAVYDEVLDRVVERAEDMTLGPGIENPDLGPLVSASARDEIAASVDQAVENGARVLTGGSVPREEGNFYAPTILDSVDDGAPISCEEIFGPILTAHEFSTEESVVERANDTEYGLQAVIWTETLSRAHRMADALESGTILVNEYPATFPQAPYGGFKQSGLGTERGLQAVHHFTEIKNVTVRLGDAEGIIFDR